MPDGANSGNAGRPLVAKEPIGAGDAVICSAKPSALFLATAGSGLIGLAPYPIRRVDPRRSYPIHSHHDKRHDRFVGRVRNDEGSWGGAWRASGRARCLCCVARLGPAISEDRRQAGSTSVVLAQHLVREEEHWTPQDSKDRISRPSKSASRDTRELGLLRKLATGKKNLVWNSLDDGQDRSRSARPLFG